MLEKDFKKLKLPFYAQDGIIELLRSAEGASITVLIKQISNNSYKVSLRTSKSDIDLSRIAEGFGGGGHKAAAGAFVETTMEEAQPMVLQAVRAAMS